MNIVRVVVFKRGKNVFTTSFKDYTNKLTLAAHNHSGFIKSENFMDVKFNYDNHTIVSISDWNSEVSWNDWVNSNTRKHIYLEYKENIISEDFNVMIKNNDRNNVFLL